MPCLLHDLRLSTEGISHIVKAVKTYSFLGQAPVQLVDVQEGLEDTLIIMRHKLRSGTTVTRDDDHLPRIEADRQRAEPSVD